MCLVCLGTCLLTNTIYIPVCADARTILCFVLMIIDDASLYSTLIVFTFALSYRYCRIHLVLPTSRQAAFLKMICYVITALGIASLALQGITWYMMQNETLRIVNFFLPVVFMISTAIYDLTATIRMIQTVLSTSTKLARSSSIHVQRLNTQFKLLIVFLVLVDLASIADLAFENFAYFSVSLLAIHALISFHLLEILRQALNQVDRFEDDPSGMHSSIPLESLTPISCVTP